MKSHSEAVLIVDDDPAARSALRVRVERAGYQAVVAAGGEEAIAAYDALHPCVVLLDVSLPDLNGFDVCRHIKDQSNPATVIFISGATGPGYDYLRQCAELCEGDRFITKPYDGSVLLDVIRTVTNKRIAEAETNLESQAGRSLRPAAHRHDNSAPASSESSVPLDTVA